MDEVEFWTVCSANGIVLEKKQMDGLMRYAGELAYWNSKINLISRKDEENLWERHILHSVSCMKYIEIPPKSRCLDIGSGGGLPGIPIALAANDIFMLLIDSIAKKAKVADMFAKHTGLKKLDSKCARAENLAKERKYAGHFDFIFARAVGQISRLIGWAAPALKNSGKFVFYKGGDLKKEIADARKFFPEFVFEEIQIQLPGSAWINENDKKLVVIRRK